MSQAEVTVETMGERVKRMRNERSWTQRDLADSAGVSHGVISHIETARNFPSLRIIMAVARGFDVPVAQLLENCAE